jgi:hypothetical protein
MRKKVLLEADENSPVIYLAHQSLETTEYKMTKVMIIVNALMAHLTLHISSGPDTCDPAYKNQTMSYSYTL